MYRFRRTFPFFGGLKSVANSMLLLLPSSAPSNKNYVSSVHTSSRFKENRNRSQSRSGYEKQLMPRSPKDGMS